MRLFVLCCSGIHKRYKNHTHSERMARLRFVEHYNYYPIRVSKPQHVPAVGSNKHGTCNQNKYVTHSEVNKTEINIVNMIEKKRNENFSIHPSNSNLSNLSKLG